MNAQKDITAGVIIIGNEILSGRTKDKNIGYIAEKMTECGIRLREARVIADDQGVIIDTVRDFSARYDYVFTSGGIGPTHDDITADSVAKAFDVDIGVHKDAYAILLAHYGEEEFTSARQRMARIPNGARLILNPVSSAPGFAIENVHVMAGVPRIMQAMMDNVLPTLQQGVKMLSVSVSAEVPESQAADNLGVLQQEYPHVDLGSYPFFKDGSFGVSLVARNVDRAVLEEVSEKLSDILRRHGGDPFVTFSE